jgi:hypothetical protein
MHHALAGLAGLAMQAAALTPPAAPDADPRAIVRQALQAAGGEAALRAHPALAWRGTATVHLPDRGKLALTGHWRLVPPDRARVETQLVEGGPATLRRLIVSGDRGWSDSQGRAEPLTPAALANERAQFALYAVIRLLPLLDDAYRLTALPPQGDGGPGLRVSHAGRHDVDVFFDASYRPVRLRTQVIDPENGTLIAEQLLLSGTMESQGVRWFKTLAITWDGRPFFEVTLTEFEALPGLPEDLFRPGG